MLFALAFNQWFPYVLLAVAIVAVAGLAARCVQMYRAMRREKQQRELTTKSTDTVLVVDGDYFVMRALTLYQVGAGKPLASGDYLLKSTDGRDLFLQFNGVVVDYADGEVISLQDGDAIRAEKDVRIKPYIKEE